MFLFGPPNVEKLQKQKNVSGLIKALGYKKDPQVAIDAAKGLSLVYWSCSPTGKSSIASAKDQLERPLYDMLRDRSNRSNASTLLKELGWKPDSGDDLFWYYVGADKWDKIKKISDANAADLIGLVKDRININPTRAGALEALGRFKVVEARDLLLEVVMNETKEQDNIRRSAAKALLMIDPDIATRDPFIAFCAMEEKVVGNENEAVEELFKMMPSVPVLLKEEEAELQFADVQRPWASLGYVTGDEKKISKLIIKNIKALRDQVPIRDITVQVVLYARAAQINLIHGDRFTGIRVWRVGEPDAYWVCGNSAFLLK